MDNRVIHKGRKIQHQNPDSLSYTVSFNKNLQTKDHSWWDEAQKTIDFCGIHPVFRCS